MSPLRRLRQRLVSAGRHRADTRASARPGSASSALHAVEVFRVTAQHPLAALDHRITRQRQHSGLRPPAPAGAAGAPGLWPSPRGASAPQSQVFDNPRAPRTNAEEPLRSTSAATNQPQEP